MDGSAWKKLILMATGLIFFVVWFIGRPHSIDSERTGQTLFYHVKTIGHGDNLPLVIALHGSGDTPDNFFDTLFAKIPIDAKIFLFRGPLTHGGGYGWPKSGPDARLWGDTLADAVDTLTATYPSQQKPVLVGFSTGGFMAYYQAAAHPDKYSFIIPVSGGLAQSMLEDPLPENESTPIIAFHGKDDDIVSFSQGKSAVGFLESIGRNVRLIPLSNGHLSVFIQGHDQFVSTLKQAVE